MNKKIAFGDNSKVRFSVVSPSTSLRTNGERSRTIRKVFYTFLHHKNKAGAIIIFFMAGFIIVDKAKPQEEPQEGITTRQGIEYKAEPLRDPFQVYAKTKEEKATETEVKLTESAQLPSLTIQGIIWGTSLSQAIINNRVLKVEDSIEGAKVIKIERDGITVLFGGREYNLSSPSQISLESLQKKPEGGEYEKYF